jgi:hypothetical protein
METGEHSKDARSVLGGYAYSVILDGKSPLVVLELGPYADVRVCISPEL